MKLSLSYYSGRTKTDRQLPPNKIDNDINDNLFLSTKQIPPTPKHDIQSSYLQKTIHPFISINRLQMQIFYYYQKY